MSSASISNNLITGLMLWFLWCLTADISASALELIGSLLVCLALPLAVSWSHAQWQSLIGRRDLHRYAAQRGVIEFPDLPLASRRMMRRVRADQARRKGQAIRPV